MGSGGTDYPVMKDCEKILKILKIQHKVLIVSAHRTPKRMFKFAEISKILFNIGLVLIKFLAILVISNSLG